MAAGEGSLRSEKDVVSLKGSRGQALLMQRDHFFKGLYGPGVPGGIGGSSRNDFACSVRSSPTGHRTLKCPAASGTVLSLPRRHESLEFLEPVLN